MYSRKAVDIPGIDSQYCWLEIVTEEGNFQSHQGVNDRGEIKAPYTSIPEHSNTPCCLSENNLPPQLPIMKHINISLWEKRVEGGGEGKKRKKRKPFSNLKGDQDRKPQRDLRVEWPCVKQKCSGCGEATPPFPRNEPGFGKRFKISGYQDGKCSMFKSMSNSVVGDTQKMCS